MEENKAKEEDNKMKFVVRHEMRNRIRVHMWQREMSYFQADMIACYLEEFPEVTDVNR